MKSEHTDIQQPVTWYSVLILSLAFIVISIYFHSACKEANCITSRN